MNNFCGITHFGVFTSLSTWVLVRMVILPFLLASVCSDFVDVAFRSESLNSAQLNEQLRFSHSEHFENAFEDEGINFQSNMNAGDYYWRCSGYFSNFGKY